MVTKGWISFSADFLGFLLKFPCKTYVFTSWCFLILVMAPTGFGGLVLDITFSF